MAILQAARQGLGNFSALVSHVLVPPAIETLLRSPQNRVQGFIAPGHVCTVVGCLDYEDLVERFHVPIVVGGFEPLDLLQAISMLVTQLEEGRAAFENAYARSVSREGNLAARRVVEQVFTVCDRRWRGLGELPRSGWALRDEYAAFDAEKIFDIAARGVEEPAECISAEILTGLKKPTHCPMFAARCTPENPMGAPMVSAEGACAAYYRYRRHAVEA
jgi:hydrogenase expression/formation protein HypD